jgi:uncharacterized protein YecE (DUF72 family)
MSSIRVGTCGFCMPQAQYYRTFAVIELQQTFYRPPQPATAERWRNEAPEGFEFTLKAFQAITHPPSSPTYRRSSLSDADRRQCGGFRDTATVRQAWKTTLQLASVLEATLVVFQCPASFTPSHENLSNLRCFFHWADRGTALFGWVPRGDRWTPDVIGELCRELSLINVVDPFQRPSLYGTPGYFRLHGIGGYAYRYSDQEFIRLRQLCTAPLTYCMFNNVAMCDDAQRFMHST